MRDSLKKGKSLKDAQSGVVMKWSTKMSKMLGIVNPSLGEVWFERVTTMDVGGTSFSMGLEKLHALRCANVANETRNTWLAMEIGPMRAQFGIPRGDRDFRLWVVKDTWFTHLVVQVKLVMAMLRELVCASLAPSNFGDDRLLEEYIMEYKMRYRKKLLASMEPDMDLTKLSIEQVDIQNAAKRVVWRYVRQCH
ncbi:hypothetical protein O6H91_09G007500 [Diphasiastrum complanatum]|uniref:Uncharacterized protein n=2 Tax=Diphasiastrum complanatum TaxID=34168 RepID=A0ACC2CL24_DIPCM|nr:hypothetical protein O6H91_09G005900 [Diphasiastrum complanatum]KAJ7542703.1 hypothetical protein O6H91_09G007500 [Diphasiastrum complanatum]